jgi:type I restriction enzyme S subunit
MNPAQLLEYFDRISEAPDAIPRLRRFILDLAVRGKLVEQDSSDEPAGELLKRVQTERTGTKKNNRPCRLEIDDLPFALPTGWAKIHFGEIYSLEYGDNLPAEKRSNTGEFPVYGSNGIVGSHSECFVKSPCIIVGRKGSAGALNLSLLSGCCVTDVAYYCIPPTGLDITFSFKLFHTLGLDRLGKGVKPGLNRKDVYALPIVIPPLAEQHRIVAKVDELMALYNQLEAAKTEREQNRDRLVAASLQRLNQPAEDEETFREHARFTFNHLPRITTRPAHIKQLRQTILNLAVRGRLVPQDPNDEPASELTTRIQGEKTQLAPRRQIAVEKKKAIINPNFDTRK